MSLPAPPDWWKQWKPLRWLAGLGLLMSFGAAVAPYFISTEIQAPANAPEAKHFTVPVGEPVLLIGGLHSYDKLEAVRETLRAEGFEPELLRDRKPRSRKYPPRDLDTLVIANYKHLGVNGRLELVFFNNNLLMAVFDVSQAEPYAAALSAAEPQLKRDKLGTAESNDGNRRVLTNVYFSAGPVGRAAGSHGWAMWQDLKLAQLRNEWEALYGLILP